MDEFKWFGITMIGFALAAAIVGGVKAWKQSETEKAAMENGYIQHVDERSGEVLWIKGK